jgi:uncharacterized protein
MENGLALPAKSGENAKMFRTWAQRWRVAADAALGVTALGVLLLAAACRGGQAGGAAAPRPVSAWFAVKVGDQPVQMQIALSQAEMARGLMERRDLGPDQGMLFVYREPTVMSFWMRNTPLPLDIGFFERTGELAEVYGMLPFDERPVRSRGGQLRFALEMNQGWFHAHGVRPGARLDLDALRAALILRGATPADYGLAP